jgi:hypothetical protein
MSPTRELLHPLCVAPRQKSAMRSPAGEYPLCLRQVGATFGGGPPSRVTLRDRETQTIVAYYDGNWTTDQCRALTLGKREAAEAHAARMRDRCPRNADLIKVEEFVAAD